MSVGAPGWDGSGKALYYLRTRGRVVDLMRVALDGDGAAAPPEIIRAGLTAGNPETFLAFQPPPSLSADGSRLVYTQRQEWSNLALMDFDQWQQGKPRGCSLPARPRTKAPSSLPMNASSPSNATNPKT